MEWLRRQFSKELWSPYLSGALLGVVGVLAVALSNTLLGASGGFENLAGMLGQAVAPKLFDNLYFNFVMPPGITWQVVLLIGIFFGGMLGALSSKTLKWRFLPDKQWGEIFGPQPPLQGADLHARHLGNGFDAGMAEVDHRSQDLPQRAGQFFRRGVREEPIALDGVR